MSRVKNADGAGLSRLFHLPRKLPGLDRIKELSKLLLNPGDRVVIETPDQKYDLSLLRIREQKKEKKIWTVPGSLRITAYSDEPVELIAQLRRRLRLKKRRSKHSVSEWAVRRFMDRLRERPKSFTKGAVDAQLDEWGRAALTHLRDIEPWEPSHSGYVSYAIRYLEDAYPVEGGSSVHDRTVVERGGHLMRYSVKPLGEEGGIGYTGWPLRSMFPLHISVFVSSAIDLVADWRKEDFLERSMRGLDHGGMIITKPSWPGLSIPIRNRRVIRVENSQSVEKMKDIFTHDPLHLRPLSEAWTDDDFTLIARSAQLLIDRKPFAAKYSSRPAWWQLRADPFGRRAASNLIRGVHSFLRFNTGYSVRIYCADRWIGMERDLILMLANDYVSARPNSIWGLVVDSLDHNNANEAHAYVERTVARYGRPASMPPSIMSRSSGHNYLL